MVRDCLQAVKKIRLRRGGNSALVEKTGRGSADAGVVQNCDRYVPRNSVDGVQCQRICPMFRKSGFARPQSRPKVAILHTQTADIEMLTDKRLFWRVLLSCGLQGWSWSSWPAWAETAGPSRPSREPKQRTTPMLGFWAATGFHGM